MPHLASKQFLKLHDKLLVVPPADLATLFLGLKRRLMSFRPIDRHMNVASLARFATTDYSAPKVFELVDAHVDTLRRITLTRKPLTHEELFEIIYPHRLEDKQFQHFEMWRVKQPMEARRLAELHQEDEERLAIELAKKKKK